MLSPRLQAVLELISEKDTKPCVLADIGTDHAYLPIEAVRANLCERAIASDINSGPLKIAETNIRAAGLSERIETRLGDGLKPLNPGEADCIVIAGMGGKRIIHILESGFETSIKDSRTCPRHCLPQCVILQPQHDLEELRRELHAHGFEITHEKLAREASRFYVIIHAQKANNISVWPEKKYFLGEPDKDTELWQAYLRQRQDKIKRYIYSISDEADRQKAEQKLQWLSL
ncbi:MAG: class I SAM-dependent methyltransferase [Defluviitaleaceae bacterium]|nr:class I SAM-dependent methyltransferase [Defluviitaleaceae bacterium]